MRTALLLLVSLALSASASAQVAVLAYGGSDVEAPSLLVGLGLEAGLPLNASVALAVRASGELVAPSEFVEDGCVFNQEVLQANLDLVAALDTSPQTLGANLLAGATVGAFGPVAQARLSIGDSRRCP